MNWLIFTEMCIYFTLLYSIYMFTSSEKHFIKFRETQSLVIVAYKIIPFTLWTLPFPPPLQIALLLYYGQFDWKCWNNVIHSREEDKLHNQGDQIPAQDEATTHHIWGQGHNLTHSQWSQNVGHLVNASHGGVHPYSSMRAISFVCGQKKKLILIIQMSHKNVIGMMHTAY